VATAAGEERGNGRAARTAAYHDDIILMGIGRIVGLHTEIVGLE
jgi:hypothetical protein